MSNFCSTKSNILSLTTLQFVHIFWLLLHLSYCTELVYIQTNYKSIHYHINSQLHQPCPSIYVHILKNKIKILLEKKNGRTGHADDQKRIIRAKCLSFIVVRSYYWRIVCKNKTLMGNALCGWHNCFKIHFVCKLDLIMCFL